MKTIIIIDDNEHALQQILHEFPPQAKGSYTFKHFSSLKLFREANIQNAFLVFLDFFLNIDQDYGVSLIPELVCEHLVCFSSLQPMSDYMYQTAQEVGPTRIKHVYSVQKLKSQLENPQLRAVLADILKAV